MLTPTCIDPTSVQDIWSSNENSPRLAETKISSGGSRVFSHQTQDLSMDSSIMIKLSTAAQIRKGPATSKDDAVIAMLKESAQNVPWCDEYERMVSGMPFESQRAIELQVHKLKIKRLCKQFSDDSLPEDCTLLSLRSERMKVMGNVLGRAGSGIIVESPFLCTYGCNISIGNNVFINHGAQFHDCGLITIGSKVQIGPNVQIYTETHGSDIGPRSAGLLYTKPVVIEDYVWLCAGVIVCPGVRIGRGAVVGAGSVVTGDVAAFTRVRGNPAVFEKALRAPTTDVDESIESFR